MTTTHSYLKTHRLSGATLSFDLAKEAMAVRQKAATARAGRAAKTLVKEGLLRITVVGLRQGSSLGTHTTEGVSSVQVLRGRATAEVGAAFTPLRTAGVVVFDEGVAHSLSADSDCELLIVVAMAHA